MPDTELTFKVLTDLTQYAGAATVTMAIVQIFKDRVKWPTQLFAYAVAFVLVCGANLLLATSYAPKDVVVTVFMALANAALVALVAIGEHQVLSKFGAVK